MLKTAGADAAWRAYGVDVTLDMFEELAEEPLVVAMKESTDDIRRVTDVFNRFGDRFDVFTGCEGEDCPMSLGSAQARPPTMQGAPKCPDPHLAEQGQWWHWKGAMPEARKECWQWNDHPYELGVYGVARKAGCEMVAPQDAGLGPEPGRPDHEPRAPVPALLPTDRPLTPRTGGSPCVASLSRPSP